MRGMLATDTSPFELAPTVSVCVSAYFNHVDPDANEAALILEDFGHRMLVSQIAGIDSTRAADTGRSPGT
jgi:hypothetical protein